MHILTKFVEIVASLKEIGEDTIAVLESKSVENSSAYRQWTSLQDKIDQLFKLYQVFESNDLSETLSDLVENELATMDKAIEEAASRIEVNILLQAYYINTTIHQNLPISQDLSHDYLKNQ